MAEAAAKGVPPDMLQIPLQQLISQLVGQRDEVPDHDPELLRLDAMLVPLVTIERRLFTAGPYDIGHEQSPGASSPDTSGGATAGGSRLHDLREANLLEEASDLLGVKHLSPAAPPVAEGMWPVQGVLYGPCQRPLVCLPTQLRPDTPCKNIIFLVDTGAPCSELSPAAFSALLGSDAEPPPRATRGIVNGVHHCELRLCAQDGNHPDIPVIGTDYLSLMGGLLTIDYRLHTVTIGRT